MSVYTVSERMNNGFRASVPTASPSSTNVYFAIKFVPPPQTAHEFKLMIHTRSNRYMREVELNTPVPIASVLGEECEYDGKEADWLVLTIFTTTELRSTTPIATCFFQDARSGTDMVAPVTRAGDDTFTVIGYAGISRGANRDIRHETPSWPIRVARKLFTRHVRAHNFSAAKLGGRIKDFGTEPVPYYGPRPNPLVDVSTVLLSPYLGEERRVVDPGAYGALWERLLHIIDDRSYEGEMIQKLEESPSLIGQILEDCIVVVALRGEFFCDQLWNEANPAKRFNCDFYFNLFSHPAPELAAGDCEDRSMAILTVFDAIQSMDHTKLSGTLRELVVFAKTLSACVVDSIVERDVTNSGGARAQSGERDEFEKHMFVWLVPTSMLNQWECAAPVGRAWIARPSAPLHVNQYDARFTPIAPIPVETAYALTLNMPNHRSVMDPGATVQQTSLFNVILRSHLYYLTIYVVDDARRVNTAGDNVRIPCRDLYASTLEEHAGVLVPKNKEFTDMWSRMWTSMRYVDVPKSVTELVPLVKFTETMLERAIEKFSTSDKK